MVACHFDSEAHKRAHSNKCGHSFSFRAPIDLRNALVVLVSNANAYRQHNDGCWRISHQFCWIGGIIPIRRVAYKSTMPKVEISCCGEALRTMDKRIWALSLFHVRFEAYRSAFFRTKPLINNISESRDDQQTPFYVHTPISRPSGYNTTLYPITVDLNLDPECRYTISVTNSFGQTASRIFLQFSHWLPAHFVAILLLAFRYQIKITPEKEIFKCGPLSTALLAGQTFFIITGTKTTRHLLL